LILNGFSRETARQCGILSRPHRLPLQFGEAAHQARL